MRIACCVPKATNRHSRYVTLIAFLLQQTIHERASPLHCTYTAGLVRKYAVLEHRSLRVPPCSVNNLKAVNWVRFENLIKILRFLSHALWYTCVTGTNKMDNFFLHHHYKHQGLDPSIRSVSRVTAANANASSVFQLFSFLEVCSGMISLQVWKPVPSVFIYLV